MTVLEANKAAETVMRSYVNDWNKFAYDVLEARLDSEQQAILDSVQRNPRTSVASGTARGKDFVAAVCGVCFFALTPKFNRYGDLVENTKVALTAPTDRQVKNIMMPEIARLYNKPKKRGMALPGRLNAYDIRTDYEEWFLTGFKADEHNHEAWSGFHAVNTMFIITEASGISDNTFGAIEGNLQGNSRILLVFNPNQTTGYAARSQKGERWNKFRLNSLTAPNVVEKRQVIPGQVDYEWIQDKLSAWCTVIREDEIDEAHDDFKFEGVWYRPEDIFRIKVLGKFPKVGEDVLIAQQWIETAQQRWIKYHRTFRVNQYPGKLVRGIDVAGEGRDSTVECDRVENIVKSFYNTNSGGKANHMEIVGRTVQFLKENPKATAPIDTIGEGSAVYSRLVELGYEGRALSCKYSESAKDDNGEPLSDLTGQFSFANMRAYLFWAVRDWLNPRNNQNPMLPPDDKFIEEATEIKWKRQSNGSIIIEPKEDIKKRLGHSTDKFDALANTFYPNQTFTAQNLSGFFG